MLSTLFSKIPKPYYEEKHIALLLADSFELLPEILDGAVDLIFADPPYFLSNDGMTCHSGKMVSVNKGEWDSEMSVRGKHEFNKLWIRLCERVLKPNGTIWISGTFHNIYSVGMALEEEGFKILNNVTWKKSNPPPNLSCRYFTHSTETVLWARKASPKARHFFNYELMKEMNGGKQMKDVWAGSLTKQSEKIHGKHPTQKPEYLLERIILASSQKGDLILDPFCGSGTTGVVAKKLGRKFIGCDNLEDYLAIAKRRLGALQYVNEHLWGWC